MEFFKRCMNATLPAKTSTTATMKVVKPTAADTTTATSTTNSQLIDGSRPLSHLVQEHLERFWSVSSLNLFIDDRKDQISSFFHGDFHIQFWFSTKSRSSGRPDNNSFIMSSLIYKSKKKARGGRKNKQGDNDDTSSIINKDSFMKKKAQVNSADPTMKLRMDKTGSIILIQKVYAATVLVDEELEQTLDNFLKTAESVRSSVVPNYNRKRRLWFQKKS